MSHANMKLGLAIAAIVGTVSVAQAGGHKGGGASELVVSGHVNRMVRVLDDGTDSDTQFVDNGTNASRVSLATSGEFAGMKVSVFSQFRWDANNSAVTLPNFASSSSSSGNLQAAYLDIAFDTEYGTFSIGRGDGAARYTQRQDLSGTELADNFDERRWGISSDTTHVGFEGSRDDRVRYDAPSFMGTNFSLSAGGDRSWEAGLTWDSQAEAYSEYMDGLRWIGAIGYSSSPEDDSGVDDRTSASVSALLDGGFNVTLGYGEESPIGTGNDTDGTYIKLGQRFGNHAFSLSFGEIDDGSPNDVETTAIGYQFNGQNGIDVYASFGQLDDGSSDDTDLITIGTRARF